MSTVQREILDDAITKHLVDLFETNVDEMRGVWKAYDDGGAIDDNKGKSYTVFDALQNQLTTTPAIEIVYKDTDTKIISIGTQEDEYHYDIIVSIENANVKEGPRWLRIMAKACQALLNDFNNRSFIVPGYNFKAYYSEASREENGFRRGAGLMSSRIPWMCKVFKPNRGLG